MCNERKQSRGFDVMMNLPLTYAGVRYNIISIDFNGLYAEQEEI